MNPAAGRTQVSRTPRRSSHSRSKPFLGAILLTLAAAANASAPPPVEVDYFFEAGCPECAAVNDQVLPALEAAYGGNLALRRWDIGVRGNYRVLAAYQQHLDMDPSAPVSMVVDRQYPLAGFAAIRDGLSVRIALAMDARLRAEAEGIAFALPPQPTPATDGDLGGRAASFTPLLVAAAGLADGLNPCAFTTIVFLTSLLATGGRRGRAVFLGGLAFCLASFATYFAIGLGLLSFLRELQGLAGLRRVVEWATIAALAVLGVLSLLDAWRYGRTGNARSVTLQLPAGIKQRIRRFARARWNGPAVFGTGLLCGAGVTLLESVCTGQMYLPTLVFMSRDGGGPRAWGLLFLYNAAFIVPLFAVFVLGALGVRSQRLADWTLHHVVPSKLLLAAVFLALAVLLAARSL